MLARFVRPLGVLALLCVLALLVTLAAGWWYGRDAQLVQLVTPSSAAESTLFGDSGPGTLIGSSQEMVIRDPGAFLEGRTAEGARYVSDTYLRAQNIYPLQLKTVRFVQWAAALGFAAAAAVFGGLWLLARRQRRGQIPAVPTR
ncbi:hypothetical protein [Deinococcus sp. Leaf326]|jgi:hypothetical protein|uniref:hypothetical protein n=1 Tax=Deinococcus sp. Leaf326 TaxID=1736338 RepID=UPI0006FE917D|nr:hypothetical protein [Deinococcus sp. Leaf326]KQR31801.1 hypothetical protein ASF71_17440 [Deinococcus sp. Leaf326]